MSDRFRHEADLLCSESPDRCTKRHLSRLRERSGSQARERATPAARDYLSPSASRHGEEDRIDMMNITKEILSILFILSQLSPPTQRHKARNRCGKLPDSSPQTTAHFALRAKSIATSARLPNVANSISRGRDHVGAIDPNITRHNALHRHCDEAQNRPQKTHARKTTTYVRKTRVSRGKCGKWLVVRPCAPTVSPYQDSRLWRRCSARPVSRR